MPDKDKQMATLLFTPPVVLESSSLFKPRVSKMRPDKAAEFYARLLFTAEALANPAWKAIDKAITDLGNSHFGTGYAALVKSGQFRHPLRRDVLGKSWPEQYIAFINTKAGAEYPPAIVGRDALPIPDQAMIYNGAIVRASLRMFAYGGGSTGYTPGISLGLCNVQKMGDGPKLAGAKPDGSEFGVLNDDAAELDRMLGGKRDAA
jgi:hypothetical protein